jgi:surface protein
MSSMFQQADSFNQPIGKWDVSNVTDMSAMFKGADSFNQPIGKWDVSGVTTMKKMFGGANSFNKDIGDWQVRRVRSMDRMFEGAFSFNQDIGRWDVSNVEDMFSMFGNASAFNQDLGDWNVSKASNTSGMFSGAELSSSNYDALLVGWENRDLQNGNSFNGGNSKYSDSLGAPARSAIMVDDSWSFSDGGSVNAALVTLTSGSGYTPPAGTPGTDDNPIGRLEVTADSAGATVDDVILQLSGTNTGVDSIRIWSSAETTFDISTARSLAAMGLDPTTNTPAEVIIAGLDRSIPTSTLYLYVTVDLTASATGNAQPSLAERTDLMRDAGILSNDASNFPLAMSSGSVELPVELTNLHGTASEGEFRLTWQTASETNNAGFRVDRRVGEGERGDAGTWTRVGFVDGAGTTTEARSYRFTDAQVPYEAGAVTYRLTQVDTDGATHVTETVTVERGVTEVQLLGTAPNPARQQATVRYALPEKQEVTLRLYDVLGRQVRTVVSSEKEGRHEQTIGVGRLPSGVYFLRLQAGGQTRTQKLTVVR